MFTMAIWNVMVTSQYSLFSTKKRIAPPWWVVLILTAVWLAGPSQERPFAVEEGLAENPAIPQATVTMNLAASLKGQVLANRVRNMVVIAIDEMHLRQANRP
jgi:hypothetical protein